MVMFMCITTLCLGDETLNHELYKNLYKSLSSFKNYKLFSYIVYSYSKNIIYVYLHNLENH